MGKRMGKPLSLSVAAKWLDAQQNQGEQNKCFGLPCLPFPPHTPRKSSKNGLTSTRLCRRGKLTALPVLFWQPWLKGSLLCMNTAPAQRNYLLIATLLPTRKAVRTKNTCRGTVLHSPAHVLLYANFTNWFLLQSKALFSLQSIQSLNIKCR